MNKKRLILLPVFILAAVGIVFGIRSMYSDRPADTFVIDIYFFNSDSSSIVPEKQNIEYKNYEDVTQTVLENIIKGPKNSKNVKIMDSSVTVNSTQKLTEGFVVDFSNDFLSDDPAQDMLAAYAVVKTLSQIPGIASVKVTVDSQDLIAPDGQPIGFLSGDDINLERDRDSAETKYVILYFEDEESGKLVKEIHTVKITDTQPLEQYVINELIKGPSNTNLNPVLASDTSVTSVQTTDGTCFINFNSNFLSNNSGDPENEDKTLYAIVNSLTELDNVNNVQILIDGKRVSSFGTVSMSGALYRNEDIIKK